ncbi:hypothetical protein TNCV_1500951 [Trichonephila clavipes]|uniref:Uncharacterized protein n=1 Tax=Trichonephila clavipes TaxID=2585209 RepID=A0A8X6S0V7_TRICX|nr:hypothetical protein TNCV_1500951 [Trichonephila clavipes]
MIFYVVELLDGWNVDISSWKYPRNLESIRVSSPGFGNDSKMMHPTIAGAPSVATDIMFGKGIEFSMKYSFKTLNRDSPLVSVVKVLAQSISSWCSRSIVKRTKANNNDSFPGKIDSTSAKCVVCK